MANYLDHLRQVLWFAVDRGLRKTPSSDYPLVTDAFEEPVRELGQGVETATGTRRQEHGTPREPGARHGTEPNRWA